MQGCGFALSSDTLLWGWDPADVAELTRFCGLGSPVGSSGLCSRRLLGRATTGPLITGDTGWGMADDTHCLGSAWLCAGWGGMEKVGPHELGYCPTLQEVEAAGCCRCLRTSLNLELITSAPVFTWSYTP